MKKFLITLFIAVAFFIAGVIVRRFVMPRKIEVTAVDINDLVDIIERYNEAKIELKKIDDWNKEAVVDENAGEEKSEAER